MSLLNNSVKTSGRYDYIIVGAGSAGCVLADRLSADGQHSVLLLEAGGTDKSIFIQMPTALSYPMNSKRYAWQFESQAEPGLDNRVMHCPRGKVLGGSSSINGMVYVRGHAKDFDQWQQQGAHDWDYQHCLPYFKKAETWMDGESTYRGGSGPLSTCNGNKMQTSPLYQAFIDAGVQAGYPKTDDYNGYRQEGFGPMHMTVKNGVRASTSNAYLRRTMRRPNFSLISGIIARKVLIQDKIAQGIEYQKGSQVQQVFANKEVILSAGSIGSPQLLQLSGIGPKEVLKAAGVELVHHLPGVGENLQDHLEVYYQYSCKQPITLNGKLDLLSKAWIGARWLLTKTGLGATNHFESCGFIRSKAGVQWPDIQYHFLPAAMRYDGQKAVDGHGYQVHVGPNKPTSRGRVWIKSNDPLDKPNIIFNYLTTEQDKRDWRNCIRLTREIMDQSVFDPYRDALIQPSADIVSDEAIDSWVKQNVESAYHPSCSCKMGADDDPLAVLNSDCQVRGIQQLRVVDSSVFPTITNGNLNAPTIMVAEKAADIILGQQPLTAQAAPVWIDENWQQQQRLNPISKKQEKKPLRK